MWLECPSEKTDRIKGVSDYIAGPVMCSASTVYTSIKESGIRPGQFAVFPGGGGGVGIQGVQLAAAMGMRAIVVDTGDDRRKLALEMGAEHFVDFKEGDPVRKVVELTEGGAHAVFVTAVQSYPISLGYLGARAGAQVMWYMNPTSLDLSHGRVTLKK